MIMAIWFYYLFFFCFFFLTASFSPTLTSLFELEEFANGSNRCRLQDQVRRLVDHFERPYLIVEADRPSRDQLRWRSSVGAAGVDASSVIFKPTSPYLCLTLASLAQTEITVLHSTSQRMHSFCFFID